MNLLPSNRYFNNIYINQILLLYQGEFFKGQKVVRREIDIHEYFILVLFLKIHISVPGFLGYVYEKGLVQFQE